MLEFAALEVAWNTHAEELNDTKFVMYIFTQTYTYIHIYRYIYILFKVKDWSKVVGYEFLLRHHIISEHEHKYLEGYTVSLCRDDKWNRCRENKSQLSVDYLASYWRTDYKEQHS